MTSAIESIHMLDNGTTNYTYPWALQNDVLHYGDMLEADDRDQFVDAMKQELEGLQHMLQVVPRTSMPNNTKPLPAVWAFKRKRLPDWSISKYKARLNVHGVKQTYGVNYWETYAPVVNWTTVRLTMILSILHVRLLRNMYGLKQAGKNWYESLTDELLQLNFKQFAVDKCLFIRQDCILVMYVDDCLLFSPSDQVLDTIITQLQKKFKMTSEKSVEHYLGLEITQTPDHEIHLRKPGLINKVIQLCGLTEESNQHRTPAGIILQPSTETDATRQYNWNYRQVIGVLNYIAASTRPDIMFAVHQCARFTQNPSHKHELAIKRIVRYLKGTRDKGIILKPSDTHAIDCYVDADFAGVWTHDNSHHPSSVYSRTGYTITFAGCPILWSSKLQTEIALGQLNRNTFLYHNPCAI